ncbi:hypothetical protein ACWF5H_02115 [Arthrobacter sp. NPDC055138]
MSTRALEWVTFGSGVLGDQRRVLRFTIDGAASVLRAVVISGTQDSDVLGPEVLRALYKAGETDVPSVNVTSWPLLPDVTDRAASPAHVAADRDVVEADVVIRLDSPSDGSEVSPYAELPPDAWFADASQRARSERLARAVESFVIEGSAPAEPVPDGAAYVRIVGGAQGHASRAHRDDLMERLRSVLAAAQASAGDANGAADSGAASSDVASERAQVHDIRVNEAGFLHMRAKLGDEVEAGTAIAATWAFEPDQVEEFLSAAGTVFAVQRRGRVDVGDLVLRTVTLPAERGHSTPQHITH